MFRGTAINVLERRLSRGYVGRERDRFDRNYKRWWLLEASRTRFSGSEGWEGGNMFLPSVWLTAKVCWCGETALKSVGIDFCRVLRRRKEGAKLEIEGDLRVYVEENDGSC